MTLRPLHEALEQHHAVDDDGLAWLDAAQRRARRSPARLPTETPALLEIGPATVSTKTTGAIAVLHDRRGGNRPATFAVDSTWWMLPYISGRNRPSRLSISACTLTVRVCGSTVSAMRETRPLERLAGIGDQVDLDALADLHEADVALRHLRRHPHACSDRRSSSGCALVSLRNSPGHDAQLEHLAGERRAHDRPPARRRPA